MNIFINKKQWSQFNNQKLLEFKQEIFEYYRGKGFPYFHLDKQERLEIFKKLNDFDTSLILQEGNVLKQYMLGLNLCNYYMPHIWEVKCGNFYSPMETFVDDGLFKKAIDKRLKMGDNISDAGIRKSLCFSNGSQRVSNFRPTIAKYIYDNYCGDGDVLDFSSGFGGRLVGALSSNKIKSYYGFDPSLKTAQCLFNIIKDFNLGKSNISTIPFEESSLPDLSFDLIFGSPPYFNTEIYSNEETQSCNRYKTKESWKNNFLEPLVNKSHNYLKLGGYFIVNIANVKNYKNLEEDFLDLASKKFKYIKTYKMALSALMKSGYKYEPIFVFKKI